MKKLRFFLIFLLFPSILFAQQRTKIILQSFNVMNVDTKAKVTKLKSPVFLHDNSILSSDSAYFFTERNYVEFFSNVHINQGDTLNIYSDFLNYDGNTKNAHLTGKVRLVDKTPTELTTNLLDYNTGTRIGQYYDGGKIVNKDVILTSKRGWYFANTKDAFFRYNVVTVTPQSTIKTDTMRYNTFSNWTYFYGPTNIKGKDDNLYTENGAYNTASENAYFGKKNLYTQGSKSLKGDSLYYDGKKGYGKAVKNIIFMDTQDKTLLKGQLGEYYKADERVVVTKNAYFAMGTKDSITVGQKKIPDSLFLGADTLETQRVLLKSLKVLNRPIVQKNNQVGADEEKEKEAKEKEKAEARKQLAEEAKIKKAAPVETSSTKKLSKKERKLAEQKAKDLKDNPPTQKQIDRLKFVSDSIRTDSLKADSLLRKIVVAKPIITAKKDTVKVDKKTNTRVAEKNKPAINTPATKAKLGATPSTKKDSVVAFNPADTVRTRAIRAYHNVRVFKTNMQATADSLFYTAADSTLRWYKNPMLWSEGTQQTGDTIHVFFKNDKIHSFQVIQNGFIVNVETDSTKFNQVKGKLITGFFSNGNVRDVYVDGNAESIYYNRDDKGVYQNMSQSVSGRIRFKFDDKELTDITYVKGDEGVTHPIDKLPKETLLTGFIWKPELRPTSKADIIKGLPAKKAPVKPKPTSKPKTAPSVKGKDSSGIKPILPVKKTEVKPLVKEEKTTDSLKKEITPELKIDTLKKN
ncbi:OstA-like protein [Pedobacter frigiditerrae]|uniref:OstA-like protein n=1 Tax=Pedobacter frigiditerrae TaxID=2530452 RepID=UPI00292F6F05|nr:OstA-like protein [Pedobacter frigiditerrae]